MSTEAFKRTALRRKLWITAVCVAPIVVLTVARTSDLLTRRERLLEAGDRRAGNLAVILTGYLAQTLSSADAALRQLAIQARRIGGAGAPAGEWLDILRAAHAGLVGVGSLSLVDSVGIIRQSTQLPIVGQSRRDAFLFRRFSQNANDVLLADPPFRPTFAPGRPILLPIGRRLTTTTGRFDGIVVATFDPESLRTLFRAVDVGEDGQVSLIHLEGIILLREPSAATAIGEDVSATPLFQYAKDRKAGFFLGPVENEPRHRTAFRAASSLPYFVTVSLSEEELLRAWRSDVRLSAIVFGGILLATALFLVALFRQMDVRALAEASLASSEERFRLLAVATNDAVWDWDTDRNTLWWNDGFAALGGNGSGEARPTIASWARHIHPDDRERVRHDLKRALDGGDASWSADYRFLRETGGEAHVHDRASIIRDRSGRAVRVIGGIVDQTAARLAEDRLREQAALLDSATDAIIVRELDHRIRFWNRGAEELYGWSADEIVGQKASPLMYKDSEAFLEATRAVLSAGSWTGELEQIAKDGTPVTVQARWTLLRNAEGQPSAVLAINTDITQRRKLEQQFLRAQRLESIGTLAGGIAHDLNNVLAPILLSIGLFRTDETDEAKLELLEIIEASARRGALMVNQVLTFARGVSGTRRQIDIRDLVRDVARIVNETFFKTIVVKVEVPPEIWPVTGDVTQLHQVLLNLCVNARDAMPEGGWLTISAKNVVIDEYFTGIAPESARGPHVQIEVEDSGSGMSKDIMDRIFDPFFTTKEPGKGTGLGLSTSLAIIKSHGGFVRVYSEPGVGTTFRIFLPAVESMSPGGTEDRADSLPRGNGELVLVVDDETSVREVVRQTLEAFGYRVMLAADGAEATSLFATNKRDIAIVLTDMMMPVMDGASMTQALRRMDPGVKVIAASGLTGPGGMAKTANSGVRHFLSKPYTAESLLTTLREVLDETTGDQ